MADPIIADHYRYQVVFRGQSGLPEDVFINNFVFRNDGLPNASIMADTVETMLRAFYEGETAQALSISRYLAWSGIAGVELRQYDLGQSPPRLPTVRSNLLTVPTSQQGSPLPREVSACLSYESEKRGPRGRGRIYLGPLTTQTVDEENGYTRVKDSFRDTIADRALDLIDSTENATWVLLSPTDGDTTRIVGGYVDDAFDTQRSRGKAPAARKFFGSYRGVNYEV